MHATDRAAAALAASALAHSAATAGATPWRGALSAALAACLLAGCGGGREDVAAEACVKAIQAKLAGRSYELAARELAAHAKAEGTDTLDLNAQITFDKSLSSEYRQTVECKVRFESGKEPNVIFLQFNWSMDDIKKN